MEEFTKEELDMIKNILTNLTFKIGSSEQMMLAERIVNKIQKEEEEE